MPLPRRKRERGRRYPPALLLRAQLRRKGEMGGDRARNARWEFLPRMRDRLREEERKRGREAELGEQKWEQKEKEKREGGRSPRSPYAPTRTGEEEGEKYPSSPYVCAHGREGEMEDAHARACRRGSWTEGEKVRVSSEIFRCMRKRKEERRKE